MSEPLDRHLAPPYDEERIATTWSRIARARQTARRTPKHTRVWLAIIGTAIATAAIAAVVAWPRAHHERPLASRDPSVSTSPGAVLTRDVTFDDASTIAIGSGGRLQVLMNEGTRFSTLLETGSAHFDVHPGGPRRWEIETALATVEVVGTAFTVTLDERGLVVAVERGIVLVHGERVPNRVARLTAGQQITVTKTTIAAAPPAPVPVLVPPAPPAPAPPHPRVTTVKPAVEVARKPIAKPSVGELVAEADRLSSAGDPAAAATLLEHARTRDGEHASGIVSFALGRLYLDALAKPELAAAAFGEVITGGEPRSLLEDAYARRVEALHRAGLPDRAVTALSEYEHAYPKGRRVAALRAMVHP